MTFQRNGTLGTRGFFLARIGNTFSAEGRTHENKLWHTGKPAANNKGPDLNSTLFYNESLCLDKWPSPWMSCSGRTANHPSWNMVRQVSVYLSFKRILARFPKCSLQMTDRDSFKFDFNFSNLVIFIIPSSTWTSHWEINRSKWLSKALRHTRWAFFILYNCNFCRFSREYCGLIFDRILTPYKSLYYALVTCDFTEIL